MNPVTALEFDRIRQRLVALATTGEGAASLSELAPLRDEERLTPLRDAVSHLLRRVQEGWVLPGGELPSLSTLLERVGRDGAVLEAEECRDVLLLLDHAARVRDALRPPDSEGPEEVRLPKKLELIHTRLVVPDGLHRELRRLILPDGTLNREAIPELSRLQREIRRLNQDLLDTAGRMIREAPQMYQGDQPTDRDGRTVVPLAASFRGRIDGIVHESSGSGETVYVEPRALVDLNNSLVQARNGVLQEIRRVLRQLSAAIRAEQQTLSETLGALVEADTLLARARYAMEYGGIVCPAGSRINLRRACHPLLGEDCVPLDIEWSPGLRLMVISGPNTGGKTVLLKTLGLLSMMNQAAVPVPVAGDSELPMYTDWGVAIGDEQSLDAALSTFSAQLRSLAEICRRAGSASLVLLDELGSGTDPEEGAALSRAVVDALIERGSTILVTTHQTVLKHYGYTHEAAANASMAFDEESHRPSYRVVPGRPGASHALEAARASGLPEDVMRRAEQYHAERETSVAEIISRLGEREQEVLARREELNRRQEEFERQRKALELERERVRTRERELRSRGLAELDQVIREARRNVEAEVRRLRQQGAELSREDIQRAHHQLRQIEQQRAAEDATLEQQRQQESTEAGLSENDLQPGMSVRHTGNGREGRVRSVGRRGVEVQFGVVRMTVPAAELALGSESMASAGPNRPGVSTPRVHSLLELDLRGFRLAEALEELERQIDAALVTGQETLAVVHGTGTGVLQKGVQDYLRERPEVQSFGFAAPEEGGFGKTVLRLG